MHIFRSQIHPGLRGAIYYASYWGVFGILEPFLNVHLLHLGISNFQIGLLSSLTPLSVLTVAPFIANFADRKRKRILILSLAILGAAVSILLLHFPRDFTGFLLVMTLWAVFLSPTNAIADGLLARMARNYKLDFGKMRLWGSITFAITSIGMGAVYQQIGYGGIFLISGFLLIPVSLVALWLEEPEKESILQETKTKIRQINWGLVSLIAASFLIGAALYLSFIFRGIYIDGYGGGEFVIGMAVGISSLTEFPTMHYANKIIRRINGTNTLLLAYGLLSAGFLGFYFSEQPWILVAMSAVKGLGFGLFAVTTVVIIDQHAPANKVATYQGITNAMTWGLAPLFSGIIGGMLYDQFGGKLVFLIAAAMPVLAGIVLSPTYRLWKQPVVSKMKED